uniref:Uncharacterized protein n=1 Tax=viral metagenome TaxID=1070528 RepID=A0A6C0LR72_9ZZZZ
MTVSTSTGMWIIITFIIIISFIYYIIKLGDKYENKVICKDNILIDKDVEKHVQELEHLNKYLTDVKLADENIFNFIRCINIPQTPICKGVEGNSNICRSKQIDCNKWKLVLENDPIASERMKLASDLYTQSNRPNNPSALTYQTKSWWYF